MSTSDTRSDELQRLKEILFGEELQNVDTQLSELRNELIVIIENQFKTQEERLKAQAAAFEQKLSDLKQQIARGEENFKALTRSLKEAGEQTDRKLQEQAGRYDEKLKELAEHAEKQFAENQQALEEVKQELLEMVRNLKKVKVDKNEIAELFGLMMQKLK